MCINGGDKKKREKWTVKLFLLPIAVGKNGHENQSFELQREDFQLISFAQKLDEQHQGEEKKR